jgi:hypothetical protein
MSVQRRAKRGVVFLSNALQILILGYALIAWVQFGLNPTPATMANGLMGSVLAVGIIIGSYLYK